MAYFNEKTSKVLILCGAVIFIATPFLQLIVNFNDSHENDLSDYGAFISATVGSLWSLAGVILVYVAISDQRTDIEINRDALRQQINEFSEQKRELALSRQVYEKQLETQEVQQFESTFFNMIHNLNEIKSKLRFDIERSIIFEVDDKREIVQIPEDLKNFFENAERDFRNWYIYEEAPDIKLHFNGKYVDELPNSDYMELVKRPPGRHPEGIVSRIEYKFMFFHSIYQNQLSHYFRYLYNVLRFIEKSESDDIKASNAEKHEEIKAWYKFYCNILQSQLSKAELFLLFYDGLVFHKMKALLEKYQFLENLPRHEIIEPELHAKLYNIYFK